MHDNKRSFIQKLLKYIFSTTKTTKSITHGLKRNRRINKGVKDIKAKAKKITVRKG